MDLHEIDNSEVNFKALDSHHMKTYLWEKKEPMSNDNDLVLLLTKNNNMKYWNWNLLVMIMIKPPLANAEVQPKLLFTL